jgi:peptide/nickel transport system permease protein
MSARLLIRLFWSGVTLLGTAVLVFFLINVVPGDVARIIAGPKASAAVLAEIRHAYHLDDPIGERLVYYLDQLAHGDLGHSYLTDQSVAQALLTRLPVTAALAATAVVMWMLMADGSIAASWLPPRSRFRCLPSGSRECFSTGWLTNWAGFP